MRLPAPRATACVAVAAMLGTAAVGGCSYATTGALAGSAAASAVVVAVTETAPLSSLRTGDTPRGVRGSSQTVAVAAARRCTPVKRPFRPRRASTAGAARNATVVAPPRDANGLPGAPPLTDEGKQQFAWDTEQGIRPGDPHGHVLFNAHTYPDGSALGNRLLANLYRGDKITVRGRYARQRLCYRVVERVKVRADKPMPRYYRSDGPPRLAIVVCSGKRLGPGEWSHRTVWFAKPIPRTS